MRSLSYVFLLFCCFSFGQTPTDTLIVGYAPAAPFVIQEDGQLEGINVWLWKRVAADLGLPYQLKQMEFPKLLTGLKQGQIDVCINPLTIRGSRSKDMEFTHSYFASHASIAVAQQSSYQKIKDFIAAFFKLNFLRGFLILFVILLFFGLLIWWFERAHNEDFRKNHKGIWDGLWWSAVTLTTVGYGDKAPKTRGGKIAAIGLMLCSLLFVSGLTASIASGLTVNQLANSDDDFNAFKDRRVGSVKGAEAEAFLKKHFFKHLSAFDGVDSGLQALKDGQIEAFIYDEPILRHQIKTAAQWTNLRVLPLKFDVQFYAFGIKKDATALTRKISDQLLTITETQEWEIVLSEFGLNDF